VTSPPRSRRKSCQDIKLGRGFFRITKSVIFLAAVCLLLSTPGLAYGAQLVHPAPARSGAEGHRPFFMAQDLCVQPPAAAQSGCGQVGSATYVTGNLTSHRGPVMHSAISYAIFWLPTGYHFDTPTIDPQYANASDAHYEALVAQYLRDLSNTAYYSIVQQYTDISGAPGTATSLGGSWIDTSPYPNSEGTRTNPLQDSDLQAEVTKAMTANSWAAGNGSTFFVLTGHNVFGCAGSSCSYSSYCAYHSAFLAANGQNVIYADVPDPGNGNSGSCLATAATGATAPNSGAFADSAVNLVAHEGFEAVTDPLFNGWYYQDTDHEIGDECVWKFGPLAGDGSDISLNGHRYLVQEMWSNKAGGCYIPPTVSTLSVVVSYQVQGGGSGFTAPTFTYYSGGVLTNATLSATPKTLSEDFGSVWNVTGTLAGSTPTERWQTGQPAGGVLRFAGTFAFAYYHQFLVNFVFGVLGGGSGFSAPSLTVVQFGYQASIPMTFGAGPGTWADAQSRYNYTGLLPAPSPNERWMAQAASGTVGSAGSVSLQYYHQYLVPVLYTGGGAVTSPPVLSYSSLGGALSAPMGLQAENLWLDTGTGYSATDPLHGSTATERWFAPKGGGTVSSADAIQIAYYHQYIVSVQGGNAQSGWFNSSSQATIISQGVFARSLGAGQRVTGYQVDGGATQPVAPTTGQVNVVLQMNGPHALDFASVAQYQVVLDSGASAALQSVTAPTVPGDSYWYDSGSTVSLVLSGAWGRDSSSGSRLVSYATDGGPSVPLTTTSAVSALRSVQVSSPHSVTAVVVAQHRLSTTGGSIQSSTGPSITGDAGWYDAGTKVSISYNYVWNETQASRTNALGVSADGLAGQLRRSGVGTFQVSVVMDKAHVLDVAAVVQYRLTISGGFAAAASPQSPTSDGFYDSGSSVSVSSSRIWNSTALTREALISYALDGGSDQSLEVPIADSGSFLTPSIAFDRPHQLVFGSAAQYLVGFRFTDALGSKTISPTSLKIGTSQPNATFDVQDSKAWLDAGSTFVVKQLLWAKVDVKPLSEVVSVGAPQNITIAARVYDATLKVSDYLGIPISGASARIQLANGTSITRTTGTGGTISMASLPLGRFNATVSYLGASQAMSADVAVQHGQAEARLPVSLPDFGAIAVGAALVALVAYTLVRRRRSRGASAAYP